VPFRVERNTPEREYPMRDLHPEFRVTEAI